MRTRTKLNFGFGLLVVLFLSTGTLTVVRFQDLQNDIGGKAVHARERRNEASLVAINLAGYTLAARNYLQTGDLQFLDEIRENSDATDEHLRKYAEHATDHEQEYV